MQQQSSQLACNSCRKCPSQPRCPQNQVLSELQYNPIHCTNLHRLQKLQPLAYQFLINLYNGQCQNMELPVFQDCFRLGSHPIKICHRYISEAYSLRNKFNDKIYARICEDCFTSTPHDLTQYTFKHEDQEFYCDSVISVKVNQEGSPCQAYRLFLCEVLNFYITCKNDLKTKYNKLLVEIGNYISKYSYLIPETAAVLLSDCHLQKGSILNDLLSLYNLNLIDGKPFEYLIRIMFTHRKISISILEFMNTSKMAYIDWRVFKVLLFVAIDDLSLVGEFSDKDIYFQIFSSWYIEMFNYYYYSCHQKIVAEAFVDLFRFFFNMYGPGLCRNLSKNKIKQFIWCQLRPLFYTISIDRELLFKYLNPYLQQVFIGTQQRPQVYGAMLNMIFFVFMGSTTVNWEMPKFLELCQQIGSTRLQNYIKWYFTGMVAKNRKCKVNGFTLRCLYQLAVKQNIAHNMFLPCIENLSISCLHFTKIMKVVLRNLYSFDHLITLEELQTALRRGYTDKIVQCEQKILKWMRGYLWSRTEVKQQTIWSWLSSGIVNFDKARQLFQQLTSFDITKNCFVYKGPELDIDAAIYLSDITKMSYRFDLKQDADQSDFFRNQEAAQILERILSVILPKVKLDHYRSCNNIQKLEICSVGVILSQIFQKKNGLICQYVKDLKTLTKSLRKPSQALRNIFSLGQANHNGNNAVVPSWESQQSMMSESLEKEGISKSQPQIPTEVSLKDSRDLENSRKRDSKKQQLKQKYQRKAATHSSKSQLVKAVSQEQVCLLCREVNAQHQHKSFLVYIGKIQPNGILSYLYGSGEEQKQMSSCFHAFHQKCFPEKFNQQRCVLCQKSGNYILPVLNHNVESQFFATVWWNSFLNTALFQKKNGKNKESELQYLQRQTKMKQVLKNRPFINSTIIYNQIISTLCLNFGYSSLKIRQKVHQYFYGLLHYLWVGLLHHQKQIVLQEISIFQQSITNNCLGDNSLINLLRLTASKAIKAKLTNRVQEHLEQIQAMLLKIYNNSSREKWLQQSFSNISNLLQISLCLQLTDPQATNLLKKHNSIESLKIPTTMQQLYKYRQVCPKCRKLSQWYCILCRVVGCYNCYPYQKHMETKHGRHLDLDINVETGVFNSEVIYSDVFRVFFTSIDKELSLFRCDMQKVHNIIQNALKKL